MHGGLSPDLQSMEQIRRVMRPTDVPDTGKHVFFKLVVQIESLLIRVGFRSFVRLVVVRS